MSFDKPLPPVVFGEEPKYVAIRLDTPDIRASLASSGLHAMANYPSQWTYLTITEALAKLSAQPQDVAKGVGNVQELEKRVKLLENAVDLASGTARNLAELLDVVAKQKEAK